MKSEQKELKIAGKSIKSSAGITLIALIITIIVLLILTGVSIATLTGENGVINKATEAKNEMQKATDIEQIQLAYNAAMLEKYSNNDYSEVTAAELKVELQVNGADITSVTGADPIVVTFASGLSYEVSTTGKVTATQGDNNSSETKDVYSVAGVTASSVELFNVEPIATSTAKLGSLEMGSLPTKEARITGMKTSYIKTSGDNYYAINHESVSDTLVIPYEVEIDGEMYKVTEVNLKTVGKDSYGDQVISNLPGIKTIIYPNTVTKIITEKELGPSLCEYGVIEEVILPNNITEIPTGLFEGQKNLKNINIPNTVTSIGKSAFYSCISLQSIDIPDSVKSIGENAFYECTSLKNVDMSNNITSIEKCLFNACGSLQSIDIPSSVISIGKNAFSGCRGLTSIDIPDSVTSIGGDAFSDCEGLTSIYIPNSVTTIGSQVFSGCTGLTSINIPSSVTSIPNNAFNGCIGLTSIDIPNSVTSIVDSAFYRCTGLTTINIDKAVNSITGSPWGAKNATVNWTGTVSGS